MEAALYLHVPFCRQKCPYCDFYSVPTKPEEEIYLKAVLREAEIWKSAISEDLSFVTFYAGGGTPSLLSPSFYEKLFEGLGRLFDFRPEELTLEANPEGLNRGILTAYRKVGFNRLSLGLQSLSEKGLRALGRRHTLEEGFRAISDARESGFENLSVDLIFGWPGETLEDLQRELEGILQISPEHLSYYELTPEKGTPLFEELAAGRTRLPEEDTVVSMYLTIHESLSAAGYHHYEISNYARPGHTCRHNLFYWKALPYLGLGPGAASFLENKRYRTPPNLTLYYRALSEDKFPAILEETLSPEEAFREAIILGLRLLEGVSARELYRRFGFDLFQIFSQELEKLLKTGLIIKEGDRLRLSLRGVILSNQVKLYFL
ncbi:MAG TPA: radical SAM family heme chaperone HemW [Thermodesulfobacteriaceae bacterium]|nr:radical SAM family heme chaperone HemW [Thermodesulfobacteriaceae bacterium]